MEKLWKWIARANAKPIFALTLFGLIASVGWQTWQEVYPAPSVHSRSPVYYRETATQTPLLELDLLAAQGSQAFPADADPFNTTTVLLAEKNKTDKEPETATETQPEPRIVRLRYDGMMTGPDGVQFALIEDSETRSRRFYRIGDDIGGLNIRVAGISGERIRVSTGDENRVLIGRGADKAVEFILQDSGKGETWRKHRRESCGRG